MTIILMVVLVGFPAFPAPRPDGRLPIDRSLISDSVQVLRNEETQSKYSAWIWGLSGAVLSYYAIRAFSGGQGSDSGIKYFAAIGALGSFGGCWNDLARRGDLMRLRTGLTGDVAATEPAPALTPETVRKIGGEFRMMHASLISASAGSVRAGCIMPVLLSGMAIFGFSMGNAAGGDLAGISMSGALGIGGPSMLYYLNIKRDLDRMDALMPRWNQSFREKKKEGLAQ